MTVIALSSISVFAKCLRVGEDGPGWGHLCHIDIFLVSVSINQLQVEQGKNRCERQTPR